ncbi:MAG: hypothetical protein O7D32_04125, partial [bacterium]|nr:hypothetical protein [bacterium]
ALRNSPVSPRTYPPARDRIRATKAGVVANELPGFLTRVAPMGAARSFASTVGVIDGGTRAAKLAVRTRARY